MDLRVGDRWKKESFTYEIRKAEGQRITYTRHGGPLGSVTGFVGRVSFLKIIEGAETVPAPAGEKHDDGTAGSAT